jgi:multidrug efflux pump subunit AcrA (membrane-fusion protein)
LHPGQYLNEGAELTTRRASRRGARDFEVSQAVAASLHEEPGSRSSPPTAWRPSRRGSRLDARVDPTTRNAKVRAQLGGHNPPAPGSSVRVQVPVGGPSRPWRSR